MMKKVLRIRNAQKDEETTIEANITIRPMSYLAFSENVDELIQTYKPDSIQNIINQEIPSLNNDSGNVTLINPEGMTIDSFDYDEGMHYSLIDDTEGVSLERISASTNTTNRDNWTSAAESARFATPGYENSNNYALLGQDDFIVNERFSPDGDGFEDLMILSYNLEKTGFIANFKIYDAAGFVINQIATSELLGTQGIITWDGTNFDGIISNLGIYIVVGELFHPDGETKQVKKVVSLVEYLD